MCDPPPATAARPPLSAGSRPPSAPSMRPSIAATVPVARRTRRLVPAYGGWGRVVRGAMALGVPVAVAVGVVDGVVVDGGTMDRRGAARAPGSSG